MRSYARHQWLRYEVGDRKQNDTILETFESLFHDPRLSIENVPIPQDSETILLDILESRLGWFFVGKLLRVRVVLESNNI
ncbi:MAG: hypothetical protein AABZ60_12625, partial [Planctomycetota bacterium]